MYNIIIDAIDNQDRYDITALEPTKWPSREQVLHSIKLQMEADRVLGLKPILVDVATAKKITPEELLDKYWTNAESFFKGYQKAIAKEHRILLRNNG